MYSWWKSWFLHITSIIYKDLVVLMSCCFGSMYYIFIFFIFTPLYCEYCLMSFGFCSVCLMYRTNVLRVFSHCLGVVFFLRYFNDQIQRSHWFHFWWVHCIFGMFSLDLVVLIFPLGMVRDVLVLWMLVTFPCLFWGIHLLRSELCVELMRYSMAWLLCHPWQITFNCSLLQVWIFISIAYIVLGILWIGLQKG